MRTVRHRRLISGGAAFTSAGVTSLTGLLVNVVAARSLDGVAFGHFSFVYIVVISGTTFVRALCGEVVLYGGPRSAAAAMRASTTSVGVLGLGGVLVLVIVGAAFDSVAFVAAAAFIPICLQDNYRYMAFAQGRAPAAALSDLVTMCGPVVVLAIGASSSEAGALAFAAWGLSALVGVAVGETMTRPGHQLDLSETFSASLGPVRRASVVEVVSTALLYQLPLLAIPIAVSYREIGTLRGLQMSFAPVTIGHAALVALLVPPLARSFEHSGSVASRLIVGYVVGLGSLTLAIAAIVDFAPREWAERVLGETGPHVQSNVWWYAVAQMAGVAAAALTMWRRIDGTFGRAMARRLVTALCTPLVCVAGAALWGVPGVCGALALAQVLYVVAAAQIRRSGHGSSLLVRG